MGKRVRMSFLVEQLDRLALIVERSGLDELMALRTDKKRWIRTSFIGGVFRGLGMAVGFTILGALVVYILNLLADANVPLFNDLINQIIEIINKSK